MTAPSQPHGPDPALLAELAAAVRSLPEVERAAAVLRREARPITGPASRRSAAPVGHDEAPSRREPDHHGLRPAESFVAAFTPAPNDPATLQEALRLAAELAPDKGTVYLSADGAEHFQSYPDLLHGAQRALTGLRGTGIRPGDSVLFQFADNRNFVVAFWACVLGGYLPTPVGVPLGYDRENAVTRKLRNAWELLDRPLILTDQRLLPAARGLSVLWDVDDLRLASLEAVSDGPETTDWFPAGPDDPVVHLLTSGSTGVPKCVRHANRSILVRTRASAIANDLGPDDVSLNWMPLDHVGGIIMHNVSNVVLRHQHVNAEIEAFLADPLRWLDWVHRFRITNTWAPNFAFSLVNERAADLGERPWDLSCLRHICNGGEAVVSRTAQEFLANLRPYGLPADAVRPTFGMSEIASGVIYSALSADDPEVGTLRVEAGSLGGRLRFVADGEPNTIVFTEVGRPLPGVRLRIVDHEGALLPEDHIGRLQVAGSTVMTGYHRNEDANRASFTDDGWFNTGDLGFLHHGSLTITGRENDLIIIQGANYLSYDIESIVERVPGTEVTFVAACAVTDPGSATDELAVFFVPTSAWVDDQRVTAGEIRARLSREIGLQPHRVIPVPRERFPKTSSGKIQRAQLVADLRAGAFDEILRELDTAGEADAGWLFERVWLPEPGRPTGELPRGTWVLFGPDHVAARLRPSLAGVRLVTVTPGERFAVLGEDAYQVAPDAPAEHGRLLDALAGRGPIGAVLHAWSLSASDGSVAGQLRTGALSVRALLHALAAREGERPPMLVLTACGLWARDGDRVDVAKATLPGLLRTAVAEHMLPLLRQVDLADDDPEAVAAAVRAELAAPAPADLVAYRDGARLAPRLRPVPSTEDAPNLVPGGLYLVTGGLGGIAFEVAQYLLAAYQTPLLLLGRTDVDAAGPDDPRAERLAELRALGEVEYRAVDVADPAALTAAVTDVERRHGPLAGVLHLASADVSGQWTDLERHTVAHASAAEFTTAYRAKVFGTLALAELLETRPDALLVLFSSVNGDFGGSSFGAYSSANGFLTGFADHWGRERGRPVRCLAWSMWTETGMNRRSPAAAAESRGFRPITDASGLESLLAALALDRVHLLIGLDPHNEHIIRELAPEHLRDAEIVLAYTATEPVTAERVRAAATEVSRRAGVPVRFVAVPEIPVRPDGEVDRDALLAAGSGGRGYVEPTTELERRLAELWAEVLGASRVGRDDRFFDLGGSSLRAAQLVARVNAALDTRMLVHQLYEHPTVGELAAVLEKETNRKDIGS